MPRHLTREVEERVPGLGRGFQAARTRQAYRGLRALAAEGVEAVAVCLLHSYANPEHERVVGEIVSEALPDAYLSLSHDILREYREYERMSTTVVNAYIGPKVGGYVKGLKRGARRRRLSRQALDHAVERRRDDAGGRDGTAGGDDGIRTGRRHHRLGASRRRRSASTT